MVTPESLLRFLGFQLVLYGLPLGLLIHATRNYRANPGQARVLIAIAIAPFAYYAYCLFAGRIAQPLLRDWEVAAWPRKTITRDNLPKLLIADAWWVGKSLVGVAPFEKAYGRGPEGWYVFERSSNPD